MNLIKRLLWRLKAWNMRRKKAAAWPWFHRWNRACGAAWMILRKNPGCPAALNRFARHHTRLMRLCETKFNI
jgi:hypothetical protein